MTDQRSAASGPPLETADCFRHGEFDARLFRCPMCAAEREADRIDEQMQRAGGSPDEGHLLGEDFDAENGAGASDELRELAAENTRTMRGDA